MWPRWQGGDHCFSAQCGWTGAGNGDGLLEGQGSKQVWGLCASAVWHVQVGHPATSVYPTLLSHVALQGFRH